MQKPFKLSSIENASLIRKFSVLFSLMSFLPFMILATLLFIFMSNGEIKIDNNLFFWLVFLTGVFAVIGFLSMRKSFVNLIRFSNDAKGILSGDLSKRIDFRATGDNEIAQLARVFNEVVQQMEYNVKQLEESKKFIQEVLLKVASGVSSSENISDFLELILKVSAEALDGSKGLLLILDEKKDELTIISSFGLGPGYAKGTAVPISTDVISLVIKQKRPVSLARINKITTTENENSPFEPPLICVPLMLQNKVIGTISLSGRKQSANFEEDQLVILSNIAAQVSLAIENARLNTDNQKAYLETINALAMAVEARDEYSRGHSDRVKDYSVKIARQIGLGTGQIEIIKEAAQLHDVGKIGLSDEILKKPDVLTEAERKEMETHPVIGEGIIIPIQSLARLRDPIRHHHEWLNGQGYPDHLTGNSISMESKILAVADSFDAMVTDRPYKKGMNLEQAKDDLLKYKGIRYDENVVDAFIKCL